MGQGDCLGGDKDRLTAGGAVSDTRPYDHARPQPLRRWRQVAVVAGVLAAIAVLAGAVAVFVWARCAEWLIR